jgi:transketolase
MINKELRKKIVEIIVKAREGHIPSSLSIVDIINYIYEKELNFDPKNKNWEKRDYFILSKGHGAAALYVVLNKYKIISNKTLSDYGRDGSLLGGHPDSTKVPGVEANTGSLGHGFPFAVGIAKGLDIRKKKNKVLCLLGDGECQEGSVWEAANLAANHNLKNITCIIDWNKSAQQLMPVENLSKRWESFGWHVENGYGHSNIEFKKIFKKISNTSISKPKVVILNTTKGKGIPFMEGHGIWHHKIPNKDELIKINHLLS